MSDPSPDFDDTLQSVFEHVRGRHHTLPSTCITGTPQDIKYTIDQLPRQLPEKGKGTAETINYLISTLLPGILQAQNGPRYFGFVVGGVTEAAQLADILSSSYDENVQVTLPGVTAATAIEARTLDMVLDLLELPDNHFLGRTITTGATASNVLGLGLCFDNIEQLRSFPYTDVSLCKRITVLLFTPSASRILVRPRRTPFLPYPPFAAVDRPDCSPTLLHTQSRRPGRYRCRAKHCPVYALFRDRRARVRHPTAAS
jgi:hypothetical protein